MAVAAIKVGAMSMMLVSLLKSLSLSRVRVFAGDSVGAEVGIAVGGGAGRVDNADGV